ncbi:2-deoxycytidine 5-triphosphate deaminase [Candidatus Nitromaritima sp. SCGC AAA799-C22]|nr:2-deoxycytidine 5-triphosphate deaminase [Candidatus Nitromaritima sp. SCGC AAA799-C22]
MADSPGFLPCQQVELACRQGIIHSDPPVEPWQVQPASLDLRLGTTAYRIQCSFLPENDKVEAKLEDIKLFEFDLREGGILEKNCVYLIPLLEEINFPPNIFGKANPKSSTGRLDMFTRVIVDGGHRFDEIPKGYRGKLYLEVIPRSFTVRVKTGLSLNQIRLANIQSIPFGKQTLESDYKKYPILFDRNGFEIPAKNIKFDLGLFISVDVSGDNADTIIAYKAKTNTNFIDLAKIDHYNAEDFWEPIYRPRKPGLILEPESFYIMMSKEKICIWPHLVSEMIAYEPNSGELRTHYAGFFDPGFGWNGTESTLNQGTRAVMEIRPHDAPFMVEDGQTFCRMKFEKIIEKPDRVYGQNINSNYHSQELKLSKYFKCEIS